MQQASAAVWYTNWELYMKRLKSWDYKGIIRESCGDYMGYYGSIRDYGIRGINMNKP